MVIDGVFKPIRPARRGPPHWLLPLSALVFAGWLDIKLGYEVSVLPLYLLPIAYAAWFTKEGYGRLITVLATATWYWADWGHPYSEAWVVHFNMVTRAAVFVCFFACIRSVASSWRQRTAELPAVCVCGQCQRLRVQLEPWVSVGDFIEEHSGSRPHVKLCPSCARETFLRPKSPPDN